MYMTITLNGQEFKVWASTVINAVRTAIKRYSAENPFWEGMCFVNGEKFKHVVCLGNE